MKKAPLRLSVNETTMAKCRGTINGKTNIASRQKKIVTSILTFRVFVAKASFAQQEEMAFSDICHQIPYKN